MCVPGVIKLPAGVCDAPLHGASHPSPCCSPAGSQHCALGLGACFYGGAPTEQSRLTGPDGHPKHRSPQPLPLPPPPLARLCRAPAAPVAALLSPVVWALNSPDRFDMYSVGIMMLQLALPPLRTDNALVAFNK